MDAKKLKSFMDQPHGALAFSGDPITYGHINLIERALPLFSKVYIAIGENPDKKHTFTLAERMEMTKKVLEDYPKIEVVSFSGMLPDFAYTHDVKYLVRGLRSSSDFEYEQQLKKIYASQGKKLDLVYLPACVDLDHISSSVSKGVEKEKGDISSYVPLLVKQALEEKVSGQYIVGVTGGMGCGKSTVGKLLENKSTSELPVHNIDLDDMVKSLYFDKTLPVHDQVVDSVVDRFGDGVLDSSGEIDIKKLSAIIFSDSNAREDLEKLVYPPLDVVYRQSLYGKKGLILVNAALIVDKNLLHMCNNNVINVVGDMDIRRDRVVAKRGYTKEQFEARIKEQLSDSDRSTKIGAAINDHKTGFRYDLDNSGSLVDLERNVDLCFNFLKTQFNW
ncbi:pantetheine-phosphate adenylyltransferase [Candidatus Woesearchaeota archaeon]|jgi:pantetheine-phosphate adenylyltransferase|nr:pantetheine-phosphate adenylyltransferase [Candidatus Woesearchaeota archaeon]MBT6519165.1 pantetheine-phosphate adenylyltransferase [Candidatus Woesearchaeota archaeon]MBT7367277.1 pantetheine-phosphate adenylyltransferase [Candidatus Woesearchaeota archaeon]